MPVERKEFKGTKDTLEIIPDFESKLRIEGFNHNLRRNVLADGLEFIAYGVQAIAQVLIFLKRMNSLNAFSKSRETIWCRCFSEDSGLLYLWQIYFGATVCYFQCGIVKYN